MGPHVNQGHGTSAVEGSPVPDRYREELAVWRERPATGVEGLIARGDAYRSVIARERVREVQRPAPLAPHHGVAEGRGHGGGASYPAEHALVLGVPHRQPLPRLEHGAGSDRPIEPPVAIGAPLLHHPPPRADLSHRTEEVVRRSTGPIIPPHDPHPAGLWGRGEEP